MKGPKLMGNPVKVKGTSFSDMLKDLQKKSIEAQKELEENGGICLHCGNGEAEIDNPEAINNFHCKECNAETDKLVKQASADPGFVHIKL